MKIIQYLRVTKLWLCQFIYTFFRKDIHTPDISDSISTQIRIYNGDINSKDSFIVSSLARDNGTVIAARSGGKVVEIDEKGESVVLNINGATDWRGLWKDSKGNVFISPHSTPILGSMKIEERGIYKLPKEGSSFVKVLSLYNPHSNIESETKVNDDTIWTFCEDNQGAIYAGVYAHTKRNNPAIYKSYDNGDKWVKIYDFNESGLTKNGRHIHSICFSKEMNALYALVGEINNIYISIDGGYTWKALNVELELAKGSAMLPVKDGIIIGSDAAYDCIMSKYYYKSNKVITTSRIFGGTIFAIRESDLSGWLYAFSKVDSSVTVNKYFPPVDASVNNSLLKQWRKDYPFAFVNWYFYHKRMKRKYPEDAYHPQHCAILLSKDSGEHWSIIKIIKTSPKGPNGFWTTGFFHNGVCLTGFVDGDIKYSNPLIIQEKNANSKQ